MNDRRKRRKETGKDEMMMRRNMTGKRRKIEVEEMKQRNR